MYFFYLIQNVESVPDLIRRMSVEVVADERREPNSRVVFCRRKIAVGRTVVFFSIFAFDEVDKYAKWNGHVVSSVFFHDIRKCHFVIMHFYIDEI